jgi:hypothetical protein
LVAEAGLHQPEQGVAEEADREQRQGDPAAGMFGQGFQAPPPLAGRAVEACWSPAAPSAIRAAR